MIERSYLNLVDAELRRMGASDQIIEYVIRELLLCFTEGATAAAGAASNVAVTSGSAKMLYQVHGVLPK